MNEKNKKKHRLGQIIGDASRRGLNNISFRNEGN